MVFGWTLTYFDLSILLLAVSVGCAFISGSLLSKKGIYWVGFLLGLLFNVFGLLASFLIEKMPSKAHPDG